MFSLLIVCVCYARTRGFLLFVLYCNKMERKRRRSPFQSTMSVISRSNSSGVDEWVQSPLEPRSVQSGSGGGGGGGAFSLPRLVSIHLASNDLPSKRHIPYDRTTTTTTKSARANNNNNKKKGEEEEEEEEEGRRNLSRGTRHHMDGGFILCVSLVTVLMPSARL